MKFLFSLFFVFFVFVFPGNVPAVDLQKQFSQAGATVTLCVSPESVDPRVATEVSVSVQSSGAQKATLPSAAEMESRFRGFTMDSFYADADGTQHYRLLPDPAATRYGIRPFVVSLSGAASASGEFVTESVILKRATERPVSADAEVRFDAKPFYIFPSGRELFRMVLWIAAALLLCAGLYGLIRFCLHRRKLRRMSPHERAIRELELLLGRHLVEKGKMVDFYVELTMVVRRYIERFYGIVAPVLTTQEFLDRLRGAPQFEAGTRSALQNFLEAADRIKFAGEQATSATALLAVEKVREYLSAEAEASSSAKGGTKA